MRTILTLLIFLVSPLLSYGVKAQMSICVNQDTLNIDILDSKSIFYTLNTVPRITNFDIARVSVGKFEELVEMQVYQSKKYVLDLLKNRYVEKINEIFINVLDKDIVNHISKERKSPSGTFEITINEVGDIIYCGIYMRNELNIYVSFEKIKNAINDILKMQLPPIDPQTYRDIKRASFMVPIYRNE